MQYKYTWQTKENTYNVVKAESYIGIAFNRLTLVSLTGLHPTTGLILGNYQCSCGKTHISNVSGVAHSRVKSCGCLQKEVMKNNKTHGDHGTVFYMRHASMLQRCNNPKSVGYHNYGGRGITVSPEWHSYLNFKTDMWEGFSEDLEIDRIDVNKGYSKENCRWVTHSENNYNKTRQSNNLSGKTGVSFHKQTNKWRAIITNKGKSKHLGLFVNIQDAIDVRIAAETKEWGYSRDDT